MTPEAIERENVSLAGYHDLKDRPGFKMGMQVVDDRWYLYLAHFWHSGWSVLDVTDPTAPSLVNFVRGPEDTMTLQMQVADGLMITSLERPREQYGPVGDPMDPSACEAEGVYVWNVADDPTTPELLAHYETGGSGTHRNFYAGGDRAWLCAKPGGFTGRMLVVLDVSDPTAPAEVARWWWPGQSPDEEDTAFDLYFHGPAFVDGERAFLSYGEVGALVLDVSDPTDPTVRSRLEFGDLGSRLGVHTYVPLPAENLAAVNSEALLHDSPMDGGDPLNYTFLVDVSDDGETGFDGLEPVGPTVISAMPQPTPEPGAPYDSYYDRSGRFGPHNQFHYRGEDHLLRSEDTLYMTYCNAGLRVFDISDPLSPSERGYFVAEPPAEQVGAGPTRQEVSSVFEDVLVDARGYIYCTDAFQGLFVLTLDDA